MDESIFTKIIKGEIPCHKVYEDADVLAFLDIHPVQPGHTLVIPKQQIEFVWEVDDELYAKVMLVSKMVATRLKQVLNTKYIGSQIVGVDVPHAHVHLIPFSTTAEFRNIPDMNAEPDHIALAKIAEELAF